MIGDSREAAHLDDLREHRHVVELVHSEKTSAIFHYSFDEHGTPEAVPHAQAA
jgi:hypothetical protein